jgi:hypothetical protein
VSVSGQWSDLMSNPHARRPRGSALRPSHATHAHRVYSRSSSFDLTHLHGSIVCSMDTSGSSGLFAATDGRVLIASHDSRAPGGAAPSPRSEAAGAAAVAAPSPRSEAAGAAAVAAPSLRSEAAGAAAVAAPSPRPAGGAPSAEDRACAHCGKRGCFLICGRCNSVYYCSSDCGRADKAKHRASYACDRAVENKCIQNAAMLSRLYIAAAATAAAASATVGVDGRSKAAAGVTVKYQLAASASAAVSALNRRSITRLHSIEIQLIMQYLDRSSRLKLGRCSRAMKIDALGSFTLSPQVPIEVTMWYFTGVHSNASSLLKNASFSLNVLPHAALSSMRLAEKQALSSLRLVRLTWSVPSCFALRSWWKSIFALDNVRKHLRSVEVYHFPHDYRSPQEELQLISSICGLPCLEKFRMAHASRAHSIVIAECKCLTHLELTCIIDFMAEALLPIFSSASLRRTLLYLRIDICLYREGVPPYFTDIHTLSALHTVCVDHFLLIDATHRTATVAALRECSSLRHIQVMCPFWTWVLNQDGRRIIMEHMIELIRDHCPLVTTFTLLVTEVISENDLHYIDAMRNELQIIAQGTLRVVLRGVAEPNSKRLR